MALSQIVLIMTNFGIIGCANIAKKNIRALVLAQTLTNGFVRIIYYTSIIIILFLSKGKYVYLLSRPESWKKQIYTSIN